MDLLRCKLENRYKQYQLVCSTRKDLIARVEWIFKIAIVTVVCNVSDYGTFLGFQDFPLFES